MITPRHEFTGFTPTFSWPLLATTSPDGTRFWMASTGIQTCFVPSWFAGWWDGSVAMGLNDVPGGQQRVLIDALTGTTQPQSDDPSIVVGAVAGERYWASNTQGGTIRVDGRVVDVNPRNLGIMARGPFVAHQRNEGPASDPEWQRWRTVVYRNGYPTYTIVPRVPVAALHLAKDGTVLYGDTSRAFMAENGSWTWECTTTSPPSDYAPILVEDVSGVRWIWGVVGGEARHIVARSVMDSVGYLLELPWGASSIDVVWRPDGWWLAWANSQGRVGVAVIALTDPLPLPISWPPNAIPEPPIDPPVEPPMPETPNHLPTVEAVRAAYPTDENLGNKRAWQISNEVAWRHRDEGFGLRFKPTGNNYVHDGVGYAVDIVFHRPSNQFVDVLGSSETIGAPQWSHAPGAVASEWRAPIDPATIDGPVEPPVDPPVEPPVTDLDVRVLALEEDLMRLREAMTGWIIR